MIEAYFDGCCEPINPGGTASFGAVVFRDGQRVWECSRLFKPVKSNETETSNNVAEYQGFISILDFLLSKGLEREQITVHGDSKRDGQGRLFHSAAYGVSEAAREKRESLRSAVAVEGASEMETARLVHQQAR